MSFIVTVESKRLEEKAMKKVLTTVVLAALVASGCSNQATDIKVAKPKEVNETNTTLSLEEHLAGGRLGHESLAFIGAGTSNKLWVFDAKYHKLVSTIDAGGPYKERTEKEWYPNLNDTHAIAFTKDFSLLFTANWYGYNEVSEVIAIDPITFRELWRVPSGKGAHHLALSPDDKYLYVANQHDETVSVIDVHTRKKIKDIPTGKGTCYLSPTMYWEGKVIESPYLFVSVDKEDKISVIDFKTNEIVKEIPVGGTLHGVNLTPDGKSVWAAVSGQKKIVVIDVETLEITKEIPFEAGPIHISFSPDGKYGYTTTGGNKIYKLDFNTHEVIWEATGTTIPAHTGISPDGKELWTMNHMMDKRYSYNLGGSPVSGVQVWDTETGELITEMAAEGMPHEIQFVPYSVFEPEGGHSEEHSHSAESVSSEELIYKKACLSCHASDLKGGVGPDISAIGGKMTDAELTELIKNGRGMMPSNLVTDEEAASLAKWLSEKK
jgi:YVTN family beta-propeller protein